jgi:DNA-3-methyladenine glycosylase II
MTGSGLSAVNGDAGRRAYAALARRDPVMRELITKVGKPDPFAWDGSDIAGADLFAGLALHIVGQQISIPAALTIFGRLGDAAGTRPPSPVGVAGLDLIQLRGVGLSTAKARALHELAGGIGDGSVDLVALRTVDDAEAIRVLSSLRGVGPWSAQMFLIHQLHRPDVLPAGDVGIRNAIHRAYRLPQRPSEPDVAQRAMAWTPYRSYAAALLWGSPGVT